MEIALMMCKDNHTPKDLRLLAQAPYFDAHLIRQPPSVPQHYRGTVINNEVSDNDLWPAGTPIHSNSIARSTREVFEEALGHHLPKVSPQEQDSLMSSRSLRVLLLSHPELQSHPTVGELYSLLKVATSLGFSIGWYEHLRESVPRRFR